MNKPRSNLINDEKHSEQMPSFEKALSELEQIVVKLEEENVTLDEAIELYARGTKLHSYCTNRLKSAQLKVENINAENLLTQDNQQQT